MYYFTNHSSAYHVQSGAET